jgi:hypothetical protein
MLLKNKLYYYKIKKVENDVKIEDNAPIGV